jgi:hypothetical protein
MSDPQPVATTANLKANMSILKEEDDEEEDDSDEEKNSSSGTGLSSREEQRNTDACRDAQNEDPHAEMELDNESRVKSLASLPEVAEVDLPTEEYEDNGEPEAPGDVFVENPEQSIRSDASKPAGWQSDEFGSDADKKGNAERLSGASTGSAGSRGDLSTLKELSTDKSLSSVSVDSESNASTSSVLSLANLPFTRDLNAETIQKYGEYLQSGTEKPLEAMGDLNMLGRQLQPQEGLDLDFLNGGQRVNQVDSRRTTGMVGAIKVTTDTHSSKTFVALPLPEPLSLAHRDNKGGSKRYPNTPLALAWYESGYEWYLFVGLLSRPHVLKIIPPKHTKPDKPGRFNALPIDHSQVLLADDASHQIQLLNYQRTTMKHLAGCGKRGHLDGPLDSCRMHSPCSLTIDPRSHFVYIADRGNHVIRKIDLMSGLMSTVVGNGVRGNSDGEDPRRQALDSPFEVSWVEPHYLIISCADNSIRSFDLKTKILETILVGS